MSMPNVEKVIIGKAKLYHGDCLELLDELKGDAVVSDPPYGMDFNTDSGRFTGGLRTQRKRGNGVNWPKIEGDDKPFDPSPWLDFDHVVLFGANHYARRLPVGTTLIWIKKNPHAYGTFLSDAEIVWSKGGHGVYCHHCVTNNGAGANFPKLHPSQKPVSVMAWVMERAGIPEGATVIDPYMGSGSAGVACLKTGRKFIGVELVREYFDHACKRIDFLERQYTLDLAGRRRAEN